MTPPTLQALHEHAAALRKLARDLVGANDADDVLQDAAVSLLRQPARPVDNVLAWLRWVVRHFAGKHRRAAAVRLQHERAASSLRADESFVADGAEAVETLQWLGDRLAALPEPYRSTLMARYLRDETPTAIAARLGVPVRTVKTRLARGLAHLRRDGAARGADWRMALATTFALPAANASTTAAGLFSLGVLGMGAMTKAVLVVGAIVLLGLASLFAWPTTVRPEAAGAADAVRATAVAGTEQRVAATPGDSASAERTAADPAAAPAALPRAGADEIVVQVVDAATDAPIESFGLREHVAALLVLGEKERPLLHVGSHRSGRVLVPASQFEGHGFVVEVASGDYLPSAWFTAKDAVEIAGERVVLVRLQRPRDVTVRVVRERTGEPIVGTRVELLRPYPASPEVTLRTIALPTERFRVQPNLDPMMVAFAGGLALQLASDITDAEGRVRLRGNPDEALALRLLGPGHTPAVRQPWTVAAAASGEVVEVVGTGGVIEVHLRPLEAWTQLRVAFRREEVPFPGGGDGSGVHLRHVDSGEQRPAGMAGTAYATDERGVVRIDGLAAGTWAATFQFPWRTRNVRANVSDVGRVYVALPEVVGLQEGEMRVVEVDVSGFACGTLDATVTIAGQLERARSLAVWMVGDSGPLALQSNARTDLAFAADAHCIAQLPPGRYFASLEDTASKVPIGEFTITTATTTRVDLVPDLVPLTVRMLHADGSPATGMLWLQRPGWFTSGTTSATGEIAFPHLLRGDRVEAMFRRVTGTTPQGTPAFGPAVQLGTVHAAGDGAVVELRLPPQ
jgi:RNA polymerase sigma factor (sigma-70 family)